MHEMSLVRSLLTQVERIRAQHGRGAVEAIEVEIGPLSGVEGALLESAFSQVAMESEIPGARLVITEVPLTAACPACGPVAVEPVRIRCPRCGNVNIRIVNGDEVRLMAVTIRGGEPQEQNV